MAAALAVAVLPAAAGSGRRPVVVELYTSQGCSSCPPADALLAKIAKQPGVVAMSLPVTYWDMLGWKDTLASEVNTRRQKAYAAAMGHGAIYTPQIIVDGISDVVGSREAAVESAIESRARDSDVDDVPVMLRETQQELQIAVGPSGEHGAAPAATVWLIHMRDSATVAIGGGENDGRTMTYRNIVGDLKAVGQWKGDQLTIDLPRAAMEGLPHDGVAVVVQRGGYGHIVGAALLSHPEFYAEQ